MGGVLFTKIGVIKEIYKKALEFSKHLFGLENFKIMFVCSATEGTTRQLISLYEAVKKKDLKRRDKILKDLQKKHYSLIYEIFPSTHADHAKQEIRKLFKALKNEIILRPSYPAIVKYGELISSTIFSLLLEVDENVHHLFDARECIRTYGSLSCAKLNLQKSVKFTIQSMSGKINHNDAFITQTFISQHHHLRRTSILPLNAGDLSAAVFAHALNADYMIFLKDVLGVLVDENGERDNPLNIIPEMSYGEYTKMFKGKDRYPVYPEAISVLGINKIRTRICSFYNLKAYGTEIREVIA